SWSTSGCSSCPIALSRTESEVLYRTEHAFEVVVVEHTLGVGLGTYAAEIVESWITVPEVRAVESVHFAPVWASAGSIRDAGESCEVLAVGHSDELVDGDVD